MGQKVLGSTATIRNSARKWCQEMQTEGAKVGRQARRKVVPCWNRWLLRCMREGTVLQGGAGWVLGFFSQLFVWSSPHSSEEEEVAERLPVVPPPFRGRASKICWIRAASSSVRRPPGASSRSRAACGPTGSSTGCGARRWARNGQHRGLATAQRAARRLECRRSCRLCRTCTAGSVLLYGTAT